MPESTLSRLREVVLSVEGPFSVGTAATGSEVDGEAESERDIDSDRRVRRQEDGVPTTEQPHNRWTDG